MIYKTPTQKKKKKRENVSMFVYLFAESLFYFLINKIEFKVIHKSAFNVDISNPSLLYEDNILYELN
jgi:hypothetical protein